MNIFFWNVPTSPMIFSQPTRHFGFFGFFLPHLRHLAAPALPPRCFAYFPFFSQTKSRRKADSHHWHLETFQKLPKINEFKRSHQKPAKTRCQCENFHLVALQLKKHPFLGTPNIGFTPVGSKPWALANGKANSPLNISSTCPPQSAVFVKDSKKIERNLGELVNQNPNTSLPTPKNCLAKVSLTWLFFDIIEHPHTWLCWFTSINCSNCATSQLICLLGLD